jgi:hypothetical protein
MRFDKIDLTPSSGALGIQTTGNRSETRRTVLLRAQVHPVEGGGKAQVVNLSRSGLRAIGDIAIAVGQAVYVSLDDITHVGAIVRWTDQRRFGLEFENALDVLPDFAQLDPGHGQHHKMRAPRITTNLTAKISWGCSPFHAKVRNILHRGMMLDTDAPIQAGQLIFVKLSNGTFVPAEVRWSEYPRIGVELAHPVSILLLTHGDL